MPRNHTRAELDALREEARRQREELQRKRAERRERFYERATAFVAAHHFLEQLLGRQPKAG